MAVLTFIPNNTSARDWRDTMNSLLKRVAALEAAGVPVETPAPAFTTQPSISPTSGTAGSTVYAATPGTVSNGSVVSRAWLLNGTAISTGVTALPASSGTLAYQETASGPGGTTTSTVQVAAVTAATVTPAPAPAFTSQPSISPNTGTAGTTTFTATAGNVSNGSITARSWTINGTVISTGLTASPASSGTLTYQETATGPGGTTQSTVQQVTVATAAAAVPAFTSQPTVSPSTGTAGTTTYTATPGAVTNGTITSRAWSLNGSVISTGLTATPASAGTLTYQEFATGAGGNASSSILTRTVSAATPTLALSPASISIASNAAAGTTVSNITNVPAGVTPSVTPNDGRLVIAGDASAGWKVVVGMSALSASTINFSVAATGATGASGVLTVTAAGSATPLTVMFVGSSTPDRYFTVTGGPANPDVSTSLSGTSFAATTTSSAGRGAKVFGDYLQQTLGRPIRLLGRGKSGSRVSGWNDDGDTTRSNAVSAGLAAGNIDCIVFILGFNDANAGTSLTVSQHTAALRSLFSKLRTELGKPNLPIILGMSQKSGEVEDAGTDSRFNALYAGENAVLSDANVYFGAHAYDLPQVDGIHLEEPQYDIHALRLARSVVSMVQGRTIARGPSVATIASLSPTETEVNFTHSTGTDFTPASGITGFRVSTDGFATLLAISAAARLSATKVKLTHTAATAGATLALDLLANANPDRSSPVRDNSVGTLPVNPTPSNLTATVAAGTGTPTPSAAFSDTFTGADGTNLTAHTSDSGHSWTAVTGTILIGGNTAYGTGGTAALSSFVPTSPDYTPKLKIKFLTLISGYQIYVLGRATAPGGSRTHYSLGYLQNGANGEGIYLGKVVSGGSFTVFGFFPYTAVAGAAPELGLVMIGNQISATLDGNVVIAPVTDTSITVAGTVGLRTTAAAALTTGPHYADLTVA